MARGDRSPERDVVSQRQNELGAQSGRPSGAGTVTPALLAIAIFAAFFVIDSVAAQVPEAGSNLPSLGREDDAEKPKQPVSVKPTATDLEIAERLSRILLSTGWFEQPQVNVRDGVVTLDGITKTQDHRQWAGDLAAKTEGSVAVVNRIEVEADVRSTFGFAGEELSRLASQAVQTWPLVLVALIIIAIGWLFARLIGAIAGRIFATRIDSPLLLAVVVKLFSIPVFLLSVYFVLQVAGLTRLALTILGGTGLAGIVIGFAFRDIAENFLASLLLSIRNPFSRGDLIEVAGYTGVVQNLNTRSTVLLTLDGNHVQIPNAMVYKSTITNFSTNPSRRAEFTVGIGYDSSTAKAQTPDQGRPGQASGRAAGAGASGARARSRRGDRESSRAVLVRQRHLCAGQDELGAHAHHQERAAAERHRAAGYRARGRLPEGRADYAGVFSAVVPEGEKAKAVTRRRRGKGRHGGRGRSRQ